MPGPRELLDACLTKAVKLGRTPAITDKAILGRIDYVCNCLGNRAGVRLLMSCMLAKLHRPEVDPRKPYTEIGGKDSFSGRTYDEQYLGGFISANRLPCNSTTAFLTPALRNQDSTLTTSTVLVGRPPQVYKDTLQLLDDVARAKVTAEQVLTEAIRALVLVRDDKQARMKGLVAALKHGDDALPLPTEGKRVTQADIDRALQKIVDCDPRIDNYIFITTDGIDDEVREYAAAMYEETNGTEIAILDCVGFVRHFLHLFHRLRIRFLDDYQALVLAEPDSAVNQPLKEAFLSLRQAAESDE